MITNLPRESYNKTLNESLEGEISISNLEDKNEKLSFLKKNQKSIENITKIIKSCQNSGKKENYDISPIVN